MVNRFTTAQSTLTMGRLAFREYPAIDAQTLVEFKGHERLFRAADGSFLLHMSSEGQPVVEERVMWFSVRDAMSWLKNRPSTVLFGNSQRLFPPPPLGPR